MFVCLRVCDGAVLERAKQRSLCSTQTLSTVRMLTGCRPKTGGGGEEAKGTGEAQTQAQVCVAVAIVVRCSAVIG